MIKPSNITLCLYTSTKGHHGHTQIYRETVDALLSQVPAECWGGMIAHIKISAGGDADGIATWLAARGFKIVTSTGEWSHFSDSHSLGYIADVQKTLRNVLTPYVLHAEDDFRYCAYDHDLEYWLHEAVSMLDADPSLVQVRIARFTDEAKRINGLRAKHGIDGMAGPVGTHFFRANDLSMNPSIFRTRDLLAALVMLSHSGLPQHIEHGTSITLKLLSGSALPFAVLNPERIRVGHIGVARTEDRDDLDRPLMAN